MLKDKFAQFVQNHPQAVDFAKTFTTTVVTLVVINAVAVVVAKGVELAVEKITGTTESEQETPAE